MAITEIRRPYEFLARWDPQTGAFRGAHIQFYDAVERDGVQIAGAPSKAFGVGAGMAFPLADIVAQMHTDALALVDAQAAQIAQLTADKTAVDQARATALAQVAELQAQLAALQPAVIDGVPQAISRGQGRRQLKNEGLLAAVEGYIGSLAPDDELRMAYEDAGTWERTSPSVSAMLGMLGKDAAAADAFFIAASAIKL